MENKHADAQKAKKGSMVTVLLKIALTAACAAAVFYVGALIVLLLMSQGIHFALAYIVGWLLPALLLPAIWLKKRKKYVTIWLMAAVLCAVVSGVNFGVVKYNASIEINTSAYLDIYENTPDYYPFEEDSKIVKTQSKTLRLTENLPRIDGATAVFPVYSAFVHAVYPETTELYDGVFEYTSESAFEYLSKWGYTHLAEKQTDIFFDLNPTKEGEAYAQAHGAEFEYTPVGTEALVFIVHKDHPVDNLTTEQIQDIYSGEITNWQEVGGKNKRIEAYQSDAGCVGQNMMERFMGEKPLMQAPSQMGYGYLYAWEEQISAYKNKSNAIGFSPRYLVADNPEIKMLSIDGAAPTQENIKNGSYPIVCPIYAVTCKDHANENVDKLLNWILSQEGQQIIEESGYTGVVSEYLN